MAKRRKGSVEDRLKAARADFDRWFKKWTWASTMLVKHRREVKRLERELETGKSEAPVRKPLTRKKSDRKIDFKED